MLSHLALVCAASVHGVYWNPGDGIPRHTTDYKWMEDYIVANNLSIPLHRALVSGGLNEEILDMIGIMTDESRPNYNELDIFRVEATYVPPMKEYLYDFKEIYTDQQLSVFDQEALDVFTIDGKLYAIPTFIDGSFLYYRKDLLVKYGYSNTDGSARPPGTWDEFESMAQHIQDQERDSGNFIYGLTMQAMAIPILTMHMMSIIASHGGGNIIEPDGTVSVRNEKTKKALTRIKNWYGTIASGDTKREHLHMTKLRFMENEESVFMIDLAHPGGDLFTYTPRACSFSYVTCANWTFYEKVGITRIPHDGPGTTSTASPHIWGMAIYKNSPRLEDSKRLAAEFFNPDWQLTKAMQLDPPTLLSVQSSVAGTVCATAPEPNVCNFDIANQALVHRPLKIIQEKWYDINAPLNFEGSFLGPAEDFMKFGLSPQGVMDDWYCNFRRLLSSDGAWPTDNLPEGVVCVCPAGQSRNGVNKASEPCTKCPVGTAKAFSSNDACGPCAPGTFASVSGESMCQRCELGKYQPDHSSTHCIDCPNGLATKFKSTTEMSSCGCEEGTYWNGACQECPQGSICDFGANLSMIQAGDYLLIQQKAGFWADKAVVAANPAGLLNLYRCNPSGSCPQGPLGRCTGNRVGLACAECPKNLVEDGDDCAKCTGFQKFTATLFLLLCLFTPLGVYKLLLVEHAWRLTPHDVVGITVELGLELIQVVGALLDIPDIHPDPNFFDYISSISVEKLIPELWRSPCLGFSTAPGVIYSASVLAIPCFVGATMCFYPICSRFLPAAHQWTLPYTINMVGKVFNTLFISQLLLSIEPFKCDSNPEPNPDATLEAYRSTICGSSGHTGMILVGVVSMLLCLAFLAFIIASLHSAKRKLNDPNSKDFIIMITFMVEDFRLECFWFNIPAKFQELLLALILVMPVSTPGMVTLFGALLVISLFIVAKRWPIKVPLMNLFMVISYCCLVEYLFMLTPFHENVSLNDLKDGAVIGCFIVGCLCGGFLFLCLVSSLANLALTGRDGTIFWITHLGREPDVKKLGQAWGDCLALKPDDLEDIMKNWQIYDLFNLERILFALQPRGLQALAMGKEHAKAMETIDLKVSAQRNSRSEDLQQAADATADATEEVEETKGNRRIALV